MELCSFQHIDEVPAKEWNSIVSEFEIFHQHHFLKALDLSNVENAKMQYLLIKENDICIATCVLSEFTLNLDLFIGDYKIVRWIKSISPNFFKIQVLFCGTPISAGHKNISIADNSLQGLVIDQIAIYIDEHCRKHKIGYSIFKEFDAKSVSEFSSLENHNYFKSYSLPNSILDHEFESYGEYMDNLRYKYRRQIKSALKSINSSKPIFTNKYFDTDQLEEHPVFTVLSPTQDNADHFYKLYCSVMERAKSKLEILNKDFFRFFFDAMKVELRILAMVFNGEVLGVFVLAKVKDELTFILTGKEKGKDEYNTYVNLLNAMVCYAIENGCKRIIMGQTSYYPKQRMGAKIFDLFIYFKAHLVWKQKLLKSLQGIIFPKEELAPLNVFRYNE